MSNLGEIICVAIDTIVSERLGGISYDTTIVCTVEDATEKEKGKYVVSDGSVRFEAYSENTTYRKGTQVLVTIPQGDYNLPKTIIGRYSANDTTPFNYTPPLEKMVTVFNYDEKNEFSLIANEYQNENKYSEILILNIKDKENNVELNGFDRLGISASFKSLLGEFDVIEGSYGVRLELTYKEGNGESHTTKLYFDNSDMYGDTYNFKAYFSQEQVFDISGIKNSLSEINVYFYQYSGFKNSQGEFISYGNVLNKQFLSNLFIKNFKLYLGYDVEKFSTDTVLLFCADEETYGGLSQTDIKSKNIIARWIHKNEDGTFSCLSPIEGKYELKWYRKDPVGKSDGYSGSGWKEIEEGKNLTELVFTPSITIQEETVKVIGFIIDEDGEKTYYTGESITFTNSSYTVSQAQAAIQTAAQIHCKDGSEGNYFIYNQNGKLNNNGEGTGKTRQLEFLWKGVSLTDSMGLEKLTWILPLENTMIYLSEEDLEPNESNGISAKTYKYYDEKPYVALAKIFKKNTESGNNLNLISTQSYAIRNTWSHSRSNNTIRCIATIGGIDYEAIEDLHFGKAGTTGTEKTLALEFEGPVALTAKAGNTIGVQAYLYSSSGDLLEWPSENVSWQWKDEKTSNIIKITQPEDSNFVNLKLLNDFNTYNWQENYHILECCIKDADSGYDLVSYLPIPIKANEQYSYIEGAIEVIYDATGTPQYNKDPYRLFKKGDGMHLSGVKWNIIPNVDNKDLYYAKLKSINNGEYRLEASSLYTKGISDNICVQAIIDEEVVWTQPILIVENKYGFSMLNQWDGSFKIDEDNGTILSTMLGAGKKNNDNTFTGVLIGDIEKGTGNGELVDQVGVYGLQDGMITYSLTEDGRATFGKANGAGQIIIDGSEGTIQSGNYNKDSSGMKINLEDGHIDAYNFKLTSSKLFLDSSCGEEDGKKKGSYLKILDQDNKILIDIGEKNYYLQSADAGMKINLNNGEILTQNNIGKVFISPNDKPYFQIQGKYNNDFKNLMYVGSDSYFLQSLNYEPDKSGLHINLQNGLISGYNLFLKGSSSDGDIIINSGDSDKPLKIGAKFYVKWNGTMVCEGATITKATIDSATIKSIQGSTGTITIGNNFYVSSSGSMTASGASISGSLSAGGVTVKDGKITFGSSVLSLTGSGGIGTSGWFSAGNLLVSNSGTFGSLYVGETHVALNRGSAAYNSYPICTKSGTGVYQTSVYISSLMNNGSTSSSKRYKHNIKYNYKNNIFDKLKPVSYVYNQDFFSDENKIRYGFIAEDVSQLDKNLVEFNKEGLEEGIYYDSILTMTVAEVQQLKKELQEIKERVNL